jgi:hypothetical protein
MTESFICLGTFDTRQTLIEDLEAPAATLCVAFIHPKELGGEDGGLVSAGPRLHFQEERADRSWPVSL